MTPCPTPESNTLSTCYQADKNKTSKDILFHEHGKTISSYDMVFEKEENSIQIENSSLLAQECDRKDDVNNSGNVLSCVEPNTFSGHIRRKSSINTFPDSEVNFHHTNCNLKWEKENIDDFFGNSNKELKLVSVQKRKSSADRYLNLSVDTGITKNVQHTRKLPEVTLETRIERILEAIDAVSFITEKETKFCNDSTRQISIEDDIETIQGDFLKANNRTNAFNKYDDDFNVKYKCQMPAESPKFSLKENKSIEIPQNDKNDSVIQGSKFSNSNCQSSSKLPLKYRIHSPKMNRFHAYFNDSDITRNNKNCKNENQYSNPLQELSTLILNESDLGDSNENYTCKVDYETNSSSHFDDFKLQFSDEIQFKNHERKKIVSLEHLEDEIKKLKRKELLLQKEVLQTQIRQIERELRWLDSSSIQYMLK